MTQHEVLEQRSAEAVLTTDKSDEPTRSRAIDPDDALSRPRTTGGDGGDQGTGLGTEFAAVPFKKILSAPLLAVVEAQSESAKTTLGFVKSLMNDDNEVLTTTFKYKKNVTEGDKVTNKEVELEVPLLVLVPMPFIRVEYMNMKFNVKLTSLHKVHDEQSTEVGTKWKVGGSYAGVKFDMSGHVTHKSKHSADDEIRREYSMEVQVHAVQDKMPGGMERVLNLLEGCIAEKTQ